MLPMLIYLTYSVPKFFRWLSERYPAISQVIAENRIPEFDCLYVRESLEYLPLIAATC
jgi:5'-3' exoribonuclease 1